MLGCPVMRSASPDVSPLGAAFLAGLAAGIWSDEAEIERLVPRRDRFEPRMSVEGREALYAGWRAAVARTVFEWSSGPPRNSSSTSSVSKGTLHD
jgi:glycerol kinase